MAGPRGISGVTALTHNQQPLASKDITINENTSSTYLIYSLLKQNENQRKQYHAIAYIIQPSSSLITSIHPTKFPLIKYQSLLFSYVFKFFKCFLVFIIVGEREVSHKGVSDRRFTAIQTGGL